MACSGSLTFPICFHYANNAKTALNRSPIQITKATPRSRTFTQYAILPLSTGGQHGVHGWHDHRRHWWQLSSCIGCCAHTDGSREERLQLQAEEVGNGDKKVVRECFNNSGFRRWEKIYGETDDVKDLILLENVVKNTL
ncbi:hypothetical protein EUGRSUZ_G02044 [Eucalyptus grandis]|uniref:Uncharacterized protein n=2 Tax=Eucalyptus grandis TaxID=71139 RepID=A0A059BEB2_EUCGR|nr:hypothetical protein EUGRSUZ_G02044 [Eucalyptus grandis]